MNIGIDIDDTISNTHEVLFGYAEKYTVEDLKREIKEPENKYLSGNGYCQRFHKWTTEEADIFWKMYYETIIKKVTAKEFAKEVINKLRKEGNKIYLITARFELPNCNIKQITIDWLKENEIEYDEIIFNAQDKQKVVKEKNIEIFIDDAIPNCKAVSEVGVKTYLMNSMENQGYEIPNVKRVYSWIHTEQEIQKG